MSPSKTRKTSESSTKARLTTELLLLLGFSTLAYYLVLAAIYALFGEKVAALLANPLFGIPVFFIARWDGARRQRPVDWRVYLKFLRLKVWKLIVILLTIFVIQFISGYISESYLEEVRPDLVAEGFMEGMYSQLGTWGSAFIFLTGTLLAYPIGGYVAAKLCPYAYLSPYSHAAVAGFIFCFLGSVIVQILLICQCGTPPSQEDIGWLVVGIPPFVLLSLFGAWVGNRTHLLHSLRMSIARVAKAGGQLSRSDESADSLINSSNQGFDSGLSEIPAWSGRNPADPAKSKGPKFTAFAKTRKQRKKRKRR